MLEQFKIEIAVFLETSNFFNKFPEQFKVVKAVNACIPVKSAIELLDTSSVVTAAILAVVTSPFLPSVSMPKAISLSSNAVSGILVTKEQSKGEKKVAVSFLFPQLVFE